MKVIRCSRCSRRARSVALPGWNITFSQGVVTGYLCPTCQTPEENVEAEINAATTDYGVDAFGRLTGAPK